MCDKRKTTRPIPHIDDGYKRYSLSEEIYQPDKISHIKNFYYDEQYQATKYEIRQLNPSSETFGTTEPVKIIHDYNIGVAFGINIHRGNCSFAPITNTSFEEDSNFTSTVMQTDNSFIVRLKSGKSILLLDAPYVYTGGRLMESVHVDTFITTQQIANISFVSEYAFSSVKV